MDFNHTIWGQLVKGFDILTQIDNVATGANNKPTTAVTIMSATIIKDTTDAVLVLSTKAGAKATDTSMITVTGDEKNSAEKGHYTVGLPR